MQTPGPGDGHPQALRYQRDVGTSRSREQVSRMVNELVTLYNRVSDGPAPNPHYYNPDQARMNDLAYQIINRTLSLPGIWIPTLGNVSRFSYREDTWLVFTNQGPNSKGEGEDFEFKLHYGPHTMFEGDVLMPYREIQQYEAAHGRDPRGPGRGGAPLPGPVYHGHPGSTYPGNRNEAERNEQNPRGSQGGGAPHPGHGHVVGSSYGGSRNEAAHGQDPIGSQGGGAPQPDLFFHVQAGSSYGANCDEAGHDEQDPRGSRAGSATDLGSLYHGFAGRSSSYEGNRADAGRDGLSRRTRDPENPDYYG